MTTTKPIHPRRWRELRSTPENFDRLSARVIEESNERNAATYGKPSMPPCEVFSFIEQTDEFPAHVLMVSPRCEIRFRLGPGCRMFAGKRIRTIHREYIDCIEWRYAKKAAS